LFYYWKGFKVIKVFGFGDKTFALFARKRVPVSPGDRTIHGYGADRYHAAVDENFAGWMVQWDIQVKVDSS
jgi:hypothetical protein